METRTAYGDYINRIDRLELYQRALKMKGMKRMIDYKKWMEEKN